MPKPSDPTAYSILLDDGRVLGCTIELSKFSFKSIEQLEEAASAKVVALVPIGRRQWGPQ